MGKIERKYLAHYIDANIGGEFTSYVRLGKDLETYSEELNPQVSIQRNLGGQPFVNMEGYQVQSAVEPYYAEYGSLLFENLSRIANNRITDDSCKTTKVDVLLNEDGTQVWAYREDCWIIPVSIGGDTSGVQIPFNVYCAGNRVYGTFDTVNKTFAETGEEPAISPFTTLSTAKNGTFNAPSGKGYSQVTVSVPTGPIELIDLSVSANGQYSSPTGYAYQQVDVNVPDQFKAIVERTISGSIINNEITTVGRYAFAECSNLETVSFPECTKIDVGAFLNCSKLSQIDIPKCEQIDGAFSYCRNLVSVNVPKCVSVGSYAFCACSSLETFLAESCTSIGYEAFYLCTNLKTVNLPKCEYVGYGAFDDCSALGSIILPRCTRLTGHTFYRCSNLSLVSFGSYMSFIGYSAFLGCVRLESLYMMYPGIVSLSSAVSQTFQSTPMYDYSVSAGKWGTIYVPASLLTAYQADSVWGVISSRFSGI